MVYGKLQKLVRDSALGFQGVNQAADNEQAQRNAYAAEHYVEDWRQASNLGLHVVFGGHNDVLIPRATAFIKVGSYEFSPGNSGVLARIEWGTQSYIASVERIATGAVYVRTRYLAANSFAVVTPAATANTQVRIATSRFTSGSQYSAFQSPGFVIALTHLSAGEFVAADFDFYLKAFSV